MLREHGQNLMHHVNRSRPGGGVAVDACLVPNIIRNIGNMNPDLPEVRTQRNHRQGIIKVLGIFGIDGQGRHTSKIPAAGQVFGPYDGVNLRGFLQGIRPKMQVKTKFHSNRGHFGAVFPGLTQPLLPLEPGYGAVLRPVNPGGDSFESLLLFLPLGNHQLEPKSVAFEIGIQKPTRALAANDPHKGFAGTFNHFHHSSLAPTLGWATPALGSAPSVVAPARK